MQNTTFDSRSKDKPNIGYTKLIKDKFSQKRCIYGFVGLLLLYYVLFAVFTIFAGDPKKLTMKKLLKDNPAKSHVEAAKNLVSGAIESSKNIIKNYQDGKEKVLNDKIDAAVTKHAEGQSKEFQEASDNLKEKLQTSIDENLKKSHKEIEKKTEKQTKGLINTYFKGKINKEHSNLSLNLQPLLSRACW